MTAYPNLLWTRRGEVSKADPGEDYADLIERLAKQFEPAIAKAFRVVAAQLADAIEIEALARAIQSGNMIDVMAMAGMGDGAYSGVWPPLHDLMREAGTLAAATIANVRFDLLNPYTETHFQKYGMDLITAIGNETREAIRNVITEHVLSGIGPIDAAREIRDVVGFGLTPRQVQAVRNYRRELENGSAAALARQLRDRRFDPTVRRATEGDITLSQAQIDRMVERYKARILDFRAQMIARTESIRGANAGSYEALLQAGIRGDIATERMLRNWMIAKDERTCPICQEIARINRGGVRMDESFVTGKGTVFLPPAHPNCLPGDAVVSASSRITAVSKRWYDGDLIVVSVSGHDNLTITPNHPVLTTRGWIAPRLLNEGDSLIRSVGADRAPLLVMDHQRVPTRIGEVADALGRSGKVPSVPMPTAAEDFHGDGMGGQIAVVYADRELGIGRDPAFGQKIPKSGFDDTAGLVAGLRGGDQAVLRALGSPYRIMGRRNLGGAFCIRHAGPLDPFLFGRRSQPDTEANQGAADGPTADAELALKLQQGSAGLISAAKVIGIRRVPFSGHVFNLEAEDNHYAANGYIVHNCRCVVWYSLTLQPA